MSAIAFRKTLVAAAVVCVAACAQAARAEVIARVNGEPITRRELGVALARSVGPNGIDAYIDRILIEQEAHRLGVEVSDSDLAERRRLEADMRLAEAGRGLHLGPEEFKAAVERQGATMEQVRADAEANIRDGELRTRLLSERILEPRLDLSYEALREHFRRTRGPRFVAAHIMLRTRREAAQTMSLLNAQPDLWSEAVTQVSVDRASIPYNGRFGPVPVDSEWGRFLSEMQPGEIRLREVDGFWHVVRLIKFIPAESTFEEARDAVRAELLAERAEGQVDVLLSELNEGSCVVLNLSPVASIRRVMGDDVAAYVNGEPVPMEHLADALVEETGERMLDVYLDRVLIMQEARRQGVTLPESEVDARMDLISERIFSTGAARLGRSAEQLEDLFPSEKEARAAKQELVLQAVDRDDLRAALLAEKLVADQVEVTEEEIREAYRERYGQDLVVRAAVFSTQGAAAALRQELGRGLTFDAVAANPDALAELGGALVGPVTVDWSDGYHAVARGLEEGQVSDAVSQAGAYHVVQLLEKREAEDAPALESVREEVERRVFIGKAKLRVQALLLKLRAEADVEVLLGEGADGD